MQRRKVFAKNQTTMFFLRFLETLNIRRIMTLSLIVALAWYPEEVRCMDAEDEPRFVIVGDRKAEKALASQLRDLGSNLWFSATEWWGCYNDQGVVIGDCGFIQSSYAKSVMGLSNAKSVMVRYEEAHRLNPEPDRRVAPMLCHSEPRPTFKDWANGVFLVYDIAHRTKYEAMTTGRRMKKRWDPLFLETIRGGSYRTYRCAGRWKRWVVPNLPLRGPIVVVGIECDRRFERKVDRGEAKKWASENGFEFHEIVSPETEEREKQEVQCGSLRGNTNSNLGGEGDLALGGYPATAAGLFERVVST